MTEQRPNVLNWNITENVLWCQKVLTATANFFLKFITDTPFDVSAECYRVPELSTMKIPNMYYNDTHLYSEFSTLCT